MCVPSFLPPGTCLATLRTAITLIEDARWGPQKAHLNTLASAHPDPGRRLSRARISISVVRCWTATDGLCPFAPLPFCACRGGPFRGVCGVEIRAV